MQVPSYSYLKKKFFVYPAWNGLAPAVFRLSEGMALRTWEHLQQHQQTEPQDITAYTACNNFNHRTWEMCMRALVTSSALALVATAALAQESGPKEIAAGAVKWGPAPDALPKGGQLAGLSGDAA
jgi:hypothetical protein